MGVADILPSPCQFGPAAGSSGLAGPQTPPGPGKVRRSEGDSRLSTAHTQLILASRLRSHGRSQKMGKFCHFLHLNNTGSIFPQNIQARPECEVEPGFSKSDNFLPQTSLRFPVSPVEALLVGRNYSGPTSGQRAPDIKVRKTDSKTELTRPGLTGSSEKQF